MGQERSATVTCRQVANQSSRWTARMAGHRSSKLAISRSLAARDLGRVRRVKAKPADAGRFASLDTKAAAKGGQLRGGRERCRNPQASTRPCKRICKPDPARPAEVGKTGRTPGAASPRWRAVGTRDTGRDGRDGRRTAHNPATAEVRQAGVLGLRDGGPGHSVTLDPGQASRPGPRRPCRSSGGTLRMDAGAGPLLSSAARLMGLGVPGTWMGDPPNIRSFSFSTFREKQPRYKQNREKDP